MAAGNENAAANNAICSICYEDLKPVVENLQSISACGHVFHELCLQQWFEYCPSTNKRNCPICKQKCSLKDPCRLYFQSSGNQIDSTQKAVIGIDEDPILLRGEVKRLEGKLQNLNSALDNQKKENVEVSEKLNQCKEQLKEDKAKRREALQEISTTQHLLKLKSEECVQLNSQCTKLQERTMALAKELASLKLEPNLRPTASELLKHPFVVGKHRESASIDLGSFMNNASTPPPSELTNTKSSVAALSEIEKKWKKELDQQLERKRQDMMRQAGLG